MDLKRFLAKGSRNLQIFVILALISEFCYLGIAILGNLREHIPLFILLFGIAFLTYWLVCFYFFNFSSTKTSTNEHLAFLAPKYQKPFTWLTDFIQNQYSPKRLSSKEILLIGVFFGLLFRLTILFTTPSLSEDIYRYIWDGRVSTNDINPFIHAPASDELNPLRDEAIFPNINHKEIPTIYPPLAQIAFHAVSKISPTILTFKITFLIFDLGIALLLFLILKKLSLSTTKLLVYLWNPLVIIEFAGSGHVDVLAILFMVLMFYCITHKILNIANLALAFSFLSKFISLIFIPILFFLKKQSRLIIPLIFVIIVAAFYVPYADAGTGLFSGLTTYASKWESNASIFALLKQSIHWLLNDEFMKTLLPMLWRETPIPEAVVSRRIDFALMLTKGLIVLTFSATVVYFWRRFKQDLENKGDVWPIQLGMILMGLFILCMSTVHPWYICWMVPFLAIVPNRAWLLLSGLVVLSYWNLSTFKETGIWQELTKIKLVEYLPFYLLLFFDYFKGRFKAKSPR